MTFHAWTSLTKAGGGVVGGVVGLARHLSLDPQEALPLRTVSPDCDSHRAGTHPLILVCAEEACMVALLHHDERDPRLIVLLQLDAGLSDGQQLMMEDLQERAAIRGLALQAA